MIGEAHRSLLPFDWSEGIACGFADILVGQMVDTCDFDHFKNDYKEVAVLVMDGFTDGVTEEAETDLTCDLTNY